MKQILAIIILALTTQCTSEELPVEPTVVVETFSRSENVVKDQSDIIFTLEKEGIYTLTLQDKDKVVSRERFVGKTGKNVFKLYTRTIQSKYLYLVLHDINNNQIGKTTIIIE